MNITQYLLRRAVQIPFTVLIISIFVFGLMHVTPGDPIRIMLGVFATPESVEALQQKYNLDKPLPEQYLLWIGRLLKGDLGTSIRTGEPVLKMILDRFPTSLTLTTLAISLALLISIPTGILSAFKQNSVLDYVSMVLAMGGIAIPSFALSLILILVFAVRLDLLPISGIGLVSFWDNPWRAIAPFILPTIALGAPQAALFARLLRASMLEVLGQDYIRVAMAKGLDDYLILMRHGLRNAIIPLITVVGLRFAFLLGSTITVEYVFAIPGLGSVLIQAVQARDFPVIQGGTLFITMFFIFANLLVDVLYAYVDPRIHY